MTKTVITRAGLVEGRLWRLLVGTEVGEDEARAVDEPDVANTDGRCTELESRLVV